MLGRCVVAMGVGLASLLALGAPAQATTAQAFGYEAHVLAQPDIPTYLNLVSNGGATTIRDDFTWQSVEPTQGTWDWNATDEIMTAAAKAGLSVLMIADTTPSWASGVLVPSSYSQFAPPTNPSQYGTFAGALAARYGAGGTFWATNPQLTYVPPAGIELWNEENLAQFWGEAKPNPATYTAMVKAAYADVKAADASMPVILGGLAPAGGYNDVACTGQQTTGSDPAAWNPLNYLQQVYADGGGGSFDAVGWHPYVYKSNATAAQMLAYNACSGWSQMASTPVSARSLMTANGEGGKPIWVTESGAPTCVSGATYSCVTPAVQADLATDEIDAWKTYSWAGNFYWYDIRDDGSSTSTTDAQYHFGAIDSSNVAKPAYAALKAAWTS